MGAKKTRWTRVVGADGQVPIRHIDRHPMPGIMVKDFIRKYEFEIDDLMPHRLRQIRLNFNFDQEIAWECDVDKAEGDDNACTVYKRTPNGAGWTELKKEKHPVSKAGVFTFEPADYYTTGLATIQKDNQNTVILSLVNKVGLSNSQRFYYLYKATADLASPHWPFRNIKVSRIQDFKAYLTPLDYQDITALGGKEFITKYPAPDEMPDYNDMSAPVKHGDGHLLTSTSDYSNLSEGRYEWHLELETGDRSDANKSSITQMLVPFTLRTTLPKISLAKESEVVSPNLTAFLARFENDKDVDESLRMVAFFLMKGDDTIAHAKFTNVLAPNFGISLPDFGDAAKELADGEYEIVAYAFDGAVGSREQYELLENVANGDLIIDALFSNGSVHNGINSSKESTKFFIDTQAPEIDKFLFSRAPASRIIPKPDFSPAANENLFVLNQDNLLKISIDVSDSNGRESAVAHYSIAFTETDGYSMQIGDTLALTKGKGQKEWAEMENVLIPDGDYTVSLRVWDEAGNVKDTTYTRTLHVDRTPPAVIEVVSDKQTYADPSDSYTATLKVEQKEGDKISCYWRLNGSAWKKIDGFKFEMDKETVGTASGRRRLEAGCMDSVGNFAVKLDIFHVGAASPVIAFPSDNAIVKTPVMAIRGTAPKRSFDDSPASYKLEWREDGGDWQTAGIDVGAGKRSSDAEPWLSNGIQPKLGDLGFLITSALEPNRDYELRLSVKDCSVCEWREDVVSFSYLPDNNWDPALSGIILAVSDSSFTPHEDILSLSLLVRGSADYGARARIHARDSKGNNLFQVSADSLAISSFEGRPSAIEGKGIWFWSESEAYYLQWNGLPEGEKIAVHYAGDADSTFFSGSSGQAQFKSEKAFQLSFGDLVKRWDAIGSQSYVLPIFLGTGGSKQEIVANYTGVLQVSPGLHGLYYKWNGLSASGRYPQGDSVTFYAEVAENWSGGMVLRDSVKVGINRLDLSIEPKDGEEVLEDFYAVRYDDSDSDMVPLGNKSVYYGIMGRDAKVSAYIIDDSKGDTVRTFFEGKDHIASHSDRSFSLSWDGTDKKGHLVSEGSYHFYIVAKEDVASNPQSKNLKLSFNVSYYSGVKSAYDPSDSSTDYLLSLERAVKDSTKDEYWRYTPATDYLIQADASGKWLPEELRSVDVSWSIEDGKQEIYGFPPQRVSLGIKRQRERLPLVIVTKIKHHIQTSPACWITWTTGDDKYHFDSIYYKDTVYFNETSRRGTFNISLNKRGLDWNDANSLTMRVFLLKDTQGKEAKELFEQFSSSAVWRGGVYLPWETTEKVDQFYELKEQEIGCVANIGFDSDKRCEYTSEKTTDGYNPNINLFGSAKLKPVNGAFFSDTKIVNDDCWNSPKRPSKLNFDVELVIPGTYWDADFGYDNLVNRTIRIDQTNKTMFGNEGYLKRLSDLRRPLPVKDSIFFDGVDWYPNHTYGMLTPFEVLRIPFVPVNRISSNNAFTFPDETTDYQYRSRFHAKFYNDTNSSIKYRAKIRGQLATERYRTDSLHSNMPSLRTGYFNHGTVDIYVSMDAKLRPSQDLVRDIPYPAGALPAGCPVHSDPSWLESTADEANCRKFYPGGSKVHYAVGDFTEADWEAKMMTTLADGNKVIANWNNSDSIVNPFDTLRTQSGGTSCDTRFNMSPSDYKDDNFFVDTGCTFSNLDNVSVSGYTPTVKNTSKETVSEDDFTFDKITGILSIKAKDWTGSVMKEETKYPGYDSPPVSLPANQFFNNEWVNNLQLNSAKVFYLNGNPHTHFEAEPYQNDAITIFAKAKPDTARPSEFIAVRGSFPGAQHWKLLYLNRSNLHTLAKGNSEKIFEWFDVNRLQGNTSILLQWGGSDGVITNIRKLDLDIGSDMKAANSDNTVRSLFGEVSVTFKPGTMQEFVTVRTADAREYNFETSNGSALLGPVIEILPSKKFHADSLPRVKTRLTKTELTSRNLSPGNVRLYKIDTDKRKFVELENTLLGFDKEEHDEDCNPDNYNRCDSYNNGNWSYLLVTAETSSFSTFAVLDTNDAKLFNEEPAVLDTIPPYITCSVPQDTVLWLGLDNGYLEMFHECNQPAMGTLQLRQNGDVVAEAHQLLPDAFRWDGQSGINKIAHGIYTSRYIALGSTGQEMQIMGPSVYTDTLRPVLSGFSVEESSSSLAREFKILAAASDDFSGIGSVFLNWTLGDVVSGAMSLNADSAGNIYYPLHISRNQLAQCTGCKLKITLRVEDKGHNWVEQEWHSDRLWPYPADLALWYPALEGSGKTAYEYTGTGHDLDLLMPQPWLSASGIYFDSSLSKAPGKGHVDLGSTGSYTLEAWVRPGHSASVWQRVLGFSLSSGKRIELQVRDGDVRLLDGFETWSVSGLLPQKVWSHLVVAVSDSHADFYIDGNLAGTVSAAPSERLWHGSFSLGTENNAPSFIGHIMQVRFYKRALQSDEAHALFKGISSGSGTETILAGELDWMSDGVQRGFSCAVPGSSYWEISKESVLPWKAWAGQAGSYRIFLYARSAQPGNKPLKAGVSGSLISGTASFESVWRPLALQGISLPLKSGFNDIELHIPSGVDIAGIALSDDSGLLPSQISWKSDGSSAPAAVSAQIRFEGHPDPSMIRPRIRLQNIGSSSIYGPKVRYYFRGEDPAQVQASKYYPQEGTLVVRQEGDNLGYAEWSFPETTVLPAGQLLFWGEGPHFGLHNTNYVPWITADDPSFAESSGAFVDAPGIIVLDSENRVLNGSCFENEMPLITTPVVQVLARDSRAGDNQASQLYIKLENIGQIPIRDYEVRYSFFVPGSTPELDVYDMQGLSASLKNLGSGRWQVVISGSASLGPGISWANPAQFALRLPNWQAGWNTADHPSYEGISAEWALAKGIEVFDALGNRIYGKEPVWPSGETDVAIDDPVASGSQVRVMAKQTRAHESNASAVRFYVENLGSENISDFEVRYWLSAAQGKQVGYQIYNNTQFSANVAGEGGSLYSGRFVYNGTLAPNEKTGWGDGLEFFFHHSDWSAWDKESDFSNKDLTADFSEAYYMAAYSSDGNIIWGIEPVLPEEIDNPAIEASRLPNGLLIKLPESMQLRLDLVNAAGMSQKFLYQGTLNAGQHTIPVDWSNIDIAKTYLVIRANGKIVSSQLLSKLGN
ncbi:MAG: hypothetical protein LBU89_02940 [Fibromonadaceae bacterium]|jgi:hypothetical protein|nr:hypothetical protein [Fibromonadaceae bacterium]